MTIKDVTKALSAAFRGQVEAVLEKHMLWSPRLEHRGAMRTDVILNDGRRFIVRIEQTENEHTWHVITLACPKLSDPFAWEER